MSSSTVFNLSPKRPRTRVLTSAFINIYLQRSISILSSAGLMCLENTVFALHILMQELKNTCLLTHSCNNCTRVKKAWHTEISSDWIQTQTHIESSIQGGNKTKPKPKQTHNCKKERRWTPKIATPEHSPQIETTDLKNGQRTLTIRTKYRSYKNRKNS